MGRNFCWRCGSTQKRETSWGFSSLSVCFLRFLRVSKVLGLAHLPAAIELAQRRLLQTGGNEVTAAQRRLPARAVRADGNHAVGHFAAHMAQRIFARRINCGNNAVDDCFSGNKFEYGVHVCATILSLSQINPTAPALLPNLPRHGHRSRGTLTRSGRR